jgi:hypothetical protein
MFSLLFLPYSYPLDPPIPGFHKPFMLIAVVFLDNAC